LNAIYASFKQGIDTLSPQNLNSTIRLFRDLGRSDQADEMLRSFIDSRVADDDFWDLDNQPFDGDLSDRALRQAFQEKLNSQKPAADPIAALDHLATGKGWSQGEIDAVSKLSKDDFVNPFKNHEGKERNRLISGALIFGRTSPRTPQMDSILATATAALSQIAGESPLNARRIRSKWGIVGPP
jgi:hypothetical protein